jgi:hypothetical protein
MACRDGGDAWLDETAALDDSRTILRTAHSSAPAVRTLIEKLRTRDVIIAGDGSNDVSLVNVADTYEWSVREGADRTEPSGPAHQGQTRSRTSRPHAGQRRSVLRSCSMPRLKPSRIITAPAAVVSAARSARCGVNGVIGSPESRYPSQLRPHRQDLPAWVRGRRPPGRGRDEHTAD